jgi:hypothetical protein
MQVAEGPLAWAACGREDLTVDFMVFWGAAFAFPRLCAGPAHREPGGPIMPISNANVVHMTKSAILFSALFTMLPIGIIDKTLTL